MAEDAPWTHDWVCPFCGVRLVDRRPATGYEELQATLALMGHCRRKHPRAYQKMWPPEIRAYYEAGQADQALAANREWLEGYRMGDD